MDMTASKANTHVIGHAGKILALEEGHFPYVLDGDLDTVGPTDFGGVLTGSFTAHPKICPVTGELLAFGYSPFAAVPALPAGVGRRRSWCRPRRSPSAARR